MKIAIIANAERKDDILSPSNVEQLAAKYGLEYILITTRYDQLQTHIKNLTAQVDGFLVAGGDGTVRCATQALIDQDKPLIILPSGTFNYFANDMKYPNDLEKIFSIIKNNKIKRVNIAQVNGYVVLNHSSIGFYTHILKLRKKHRNIVGKNKLLKIIYTSIILFQVIPIYHLIIKTDDKFINTQTCLVFIGNLLEMGTRESLSKNKLDIYILKCQTRWELFKCILSVIFHTYHQEKYLTHYLSEDIKISADSKQLNVVIDGDLFKLDAPLLYTLHNKQLLVYEAND